MKFCKLWVAVLFGMTTIPLLASGYGVYEQGVQGLGNAGAYVARAEDSSAVFFNPAALSHLRFNEVAIAARPVLSKSYYSNPGQTTWSSDPTTSVLPNITANFKKGRFGLGLGILSTFQHELTWDDPSFPGRFLSNGSEVSTQEFMLGAGVDMGGGFAFGATFRLARAEFHQDAVHSRPLDAGNPVLFYEAGQQIEVDGDTTGFSAGFHYDRGRRFKLGLSYQSELEFDLDGDQTWQLLTRQQDQRAIAAFNNTFAEGSVSSMLTMPERITIGMVTRVTVRTRLELNVSHEGWSSVERMVFQTGDDASTLERNWDDTLSFRIGADFQQRKALLWRIGLASTSGVGPQNTLEPGFPDYDRFSYAFGISYTFQKKYVLEASWLYMQNRDRRVEDKELIVSANPPDYVTPTGQEGLFETQRTHFNLGVRILLGTGK